MTANFDAIDRQILDLLQQRDRPVGEIAEAVGLSQTPCWRRIRRMEEAGVIRERVALTDPNKIGVPMTVFMSLTAPCHNMAQLAKFREIIDTIPQIVEAYRLAGTVDYILKILVPDVAAYDQVYKKMIEKLEFSQISASISMEELKFTTALPTCYLL